MVYRVIVPYDKLIFNEKNIIDSNVFLKEVWCEEEIIFLLNSSFFKVGTDEKIADKVAILSNGDIECEYNHSQRNAIKNI